MNIIYKEVNKLEYFETKIIKVKKEKEKCKYKEHYFICPICGEKLNHKHKEDEVKKNNIVNGENLDKIMFPCFCSYQIIEGKKHIGQIIVYHSNDKIEYRLFSIEKQKKDIIFTTTNKSLKNLIKDWGIHILKGKILIFEEVK